MKKLTSLLALALLLALPGLPSHASFTQPTTNTVTGDSYPNAYWVPITINLDFAAQQGYIVFAAYEDAAHRAAYPGSYFATKSYTVNNTGSLLSFDNTFGVNSGTNAVRVKAESMALSWLDTEPVGHVAGDGTPAVSFFALAVHNPATF